MSSVSLLLSSLHCTSLLVFFWLSSTSSTLSLSPLYPSLFFFHLTLHFSPPLLTIYLYLIWSHLLSYVLCSIFAPPSHFSSPPNFPLSISLFCASQSRLLPSSLASPLAPHCKELRKGVIQGSLAVCVYVLVFARVWVIECVVVGMLHA